MNYLRAPREITPEQVDDALLIDVREPDEVAVLAIPGATRIPLDALTADITAVATPDTPLVLVCASGARSLTGAQELLDLGYRDVASLAGGIAAWQAAGKPVRAGGPLSADAQARYARQVRLPEVGQAGQARLLASRVLLLGAGGLGSPIALYLAAAGVGTLGIVDDDVVDVSNLQRQILHDTSGVGTPKAQSAKARLAALNPDVRVIVYEERFGSDNGREILAAGWDVIVDGVDNLATRYLLNDLALDARTPVVSGAVLGFDGQVSVYGLPDGPCYRCVHAEPPPASMAPSCSVNGVLGAMVGVIGTVQAVEVLKVLLGIGRPMAGRMLLYDALMGDWTVLRTARRADCESCGTQAHLDDEGRRVPVDYVQMCAI